VSANATVNVRVKIRALMRTLAAAGPAQAPVYLV
jgi:hypothetical protein